VKLNTGFFKSFKDRLEIPKSFEGREFFEDPPMFCGMVWGEKREGVMWGENPSYTVF